MVFVLLTDLAVGAVESNGTTASVGVSYRLAAASVETRSRTEQHSEMPLVLR